MLTISALSTNKPDNEKAFNESPSILIVFTIIVVSHVGTRLTSLRVIELRSWGPKLNEGWIYF